MRIAILIGVALTALSGSAALAQGLAPRQGSAPHGPTHGFAIQGDLKYPANFDHFDYVNPNAPKGGDVTLQATQRGTFDSFNPFILRGNPSAAAAALFQTMTIRSGDEPGSSYCVICETMETPEDRSWVEFTLRREAKFQDGSPITPEDILWTFETLKTKGHPMYRSYYADVMKAEKTGERKVKFTFRDATNRELPGIISEMPVLSKAYWASRDFEKTTLEAPLGSGLYKIDSFEPGRYVLLRRIPNHWAENLAPVKGTNNFDTIRYVYYRDEIVAREAFLAGEYDIRYETSSKDWATAYDAPVVASGQVKRDMIETEKERVMQGFFMNTRRPIFADRRVRQALTYMFDFEWTNKNLFYGYYTRIRSYFGRDHDLAAHGVPEGEELKILEPFRAKLPPELFTAEYNPPKTDGTGNIRDNQREALRLLQAAGWRVQNQKLVDAGGKQMAFEILLDQPTFERVALPYVENLRKIGVDARVRTIDQAQYQRRIDEFDFDMTVDLVAQSESPGNEQRDFWGSAAADIHGSRNTAGIKDPVVDALIDLVIAAPDRKTLELRTRALDRVLQWGFYEVPHWRLYKDWVAYWDRFGHPAYVPKIGYSPGLWWVDAQKDAALRARRNAAPK